MFLHPDVVFCGVVCEIASSYPVGLIILSYLVTAAACYLCLNLHKEGSNRVAQVLMQPSTPCTFVCHRHFSEKRQSVINIFTMKS